MITSSPADIFGAHLKPKETITVLQDALKKRDISISQLFDFYDQAKDAQKGSCLAALAEIVIEDPQFVEAYVERIVAEVGHPANRVSWEASEILARIASTFPQRVAQAVPTLQKNALNGGTVIKWSAAYALTEIAMAHKDAAEKLQSFFESRVSKEENNGVRKIYEKYLQAN